MSNNKISSHPPKKISIEEFISEPEQKKKHISTIRNQYFEEKKPWEEFNVRADVQKVFTVKLSEEYILKIKYISKKTNISQQKIIRDIIYKEIDKLVSNF